jgi:hypothetical protein
MPQRKHDRVDLVDAELVEEMLGSRGWQLVQQRIAETVATQMRALVQPQTEIETATLRGFIAGLQLAASVPKILQGEAKNDAKENARK